MISHFTLRKATEADFDALYTIYMDPTVNPYLSFAILSKEAFKPIFDELFHSGEMLVYVGDDKVLATCIVKRGKRRSAHTATLTTLATHPAYHGQGIGTRFMSELISQLQELGIIRLDLLAEVDNPKAVRFYEKMGFQHEGILKNYFLRENTDHFIDEHLMALILD